MQHLKKETKVETIIGAARVLREDKWKLLWRTIREAELISFKATRRSSKHPHKNEDILFTSLCKVLHKEATEEEIDKLFVLLKEKELI